MVRAALQSVDPFGNLLTSIDEAGSVTTQAYDLADRLTSVTPSGGSTTTFRYDALDRTRDRTTGGVTESIDYVALSTAAYRLAGTGTTTTATIDASGSRVVVQRASTAGFALPDLAGSGAAELKTDLTGFLAARRDDPYGVGLATWSGGSGYVNPWRYRGELVLAGTESDPLYELGARTYRPTLAAFTGLDTYPGTAADPASLNRYRYAEANPATIARRA